MKRRVKSVLAKGTIQLDIYCPLDRRLAHCMFAPGLNSQISIVRYLSMILSRTWTPTARSGVEEY